MKLEIKGNENYSAQIVEIKETHPLENADNIIGTSIMGNHVIVSKDTKVGDTGVFFPVESKLSADYLKFNNLYRDKTLNADQTIGGFFELNGRIRCVKLRGHKSEGLFMPLESLAYLFNLGDSIFEIMGLKGKVGESFDHINDIKICEKYIIPKRYQSQGGSKKGKKAKISRILNNQFFFHIETAQLYKNLHKVELDDEWQISAKWHGTSAISSYILCNKKLNIFQKLLLKCGIQLQTKYYDWIWSSRKVIKNQFLNKDNFIYKLYIWSKKE